MRPLANIRNLVRSVYRALRDPDVQVVVTLALTVISVATVFYWFVEGWSLLDAAYFSVVTIATVGFGDLAPKTVLGKLFTIGYVFTGIGIFAAAVSAIARSALKSTSRKD